MGSFSASLAGSRAGQTGLVGGVEKEKAQSAPAHRAGVRKSQPVAAPPAEKRAPGRWPAVPPLLPHRPRFLPGGFAGLPVTPPGPAFLCLGPYFTGEQIPVGRVAAENQELKAILNELSK